jgi:DNA-directed RNA polymerase subunit RPC12/RpoP
MDLRTKCSKCGKPMDYSEMRAIPGKGYMCVECFKSPEDRAKGIPGSNPGVTPTAPRPKVEAKPKQQSMFGVKNYICDKCKYKFSRSADMIVEKCPYCAGKNFHERSLDSTDRLLSENNY